VMRIALGQASELDEELAAFALQLGLSGIQFNTARLPDDAGYWRYDDLARLRDRCTEHGLILEALENVPMKFMIDFLLGTAKADEALDNYCKTIVNMGRAGVPVLGYHFMPTFVWRTDLQAAGRGGARVTAFASDKMSAGNQVDYPQADPRTRISREQMWVNYERFLRTVLPVAERSGVRLALHPDDPPVQATLDVSRIFFCIENLQRAHAMSGDSPVWGLDLCLGTVSAMQDPASVRRAIEYFGPLGRIFYVHFRNVIGRVPTFTESFLDEGNFDPLSTMTLLRDNGFDGFMLDDHVPQMVGDTSWGHRARAHAIGYMQALLSSVTRNDAPGRKDMSACGSL
jgi:mannonate dehydratase